LDDKKRGVRAERESPCLPWSKIDDDDEDEDDCSEGDECGEMMKEESMLASPLD
jgi:hypothetical protein